MIRLLAFAILLTSVGVGRAETAEDVRLNAYIGAGFSAMDGNKDGLVDSAEFDRFMRARIDRQKTRFEAEFAKLDTDKDGRIDRREAATGNPMVAKYFDTIDGMGDEKDDAITKDELRSAMWAAQASEIGQR